MSVFKKISVLGKGYLGSAIVQQLVAFGFEVTVLSRNASSIEGLPKSVIVKEVDYTSEESLINALQGQDVVVATLGTQAISIQKDIIDASIAAGVKRYIPSDWGSLTTDPRLRDHPFNRRVTPIQDYLREKAKNSQLEYTIFSVGAFLDMILDVPFILDIKTKSVQLYDEGQHAFSSTSTTGIGKAVAGALTKPEETKNRNLFVHEAMLTQSKVLAIGKKYSPSGTQWSETNFDASDEYDKSVKNLEKDPSNYGFVFASLKAALLCGQFAAAYPVVDNELVGLPILSEEDLEATLAPKFQAEN
ncbi:hypothetical protein BGZ63DRAFT_454530 [Mariannaea sp. PMI_226]|nr:hypothetical protein BGZ63DRAFT_454530 [Mariannaea sp. PMI_226]